MKAWPRSSALVLLVSILGAGCAETPDQQASLSFDGLQRVSHESFDEVYVRPGVDFSRYRAYGFVDCQVAFRRNWLRDQNNDRLSLTDRVTQKDMERIKAWLSSDCVKYFRTALLREPAYNLVEDVQQGEAVLLLSPAIVDLDINAPDVGMSSPMTRSYTTSAGEMTLLLELHDATTGEILARVLDHKRDSDKGYFTWSTSVSNRAEADAVLKSWAASLRKGLDKVATSGTFIRKE